MTSCVVTYGSLNSKPHNRLDAYIIPQHDGGNIKLGGHMEARVKIQTKVIYCVTCLRYKTHVLNAAMNRYVCTFCADVSILEHVREADGADLAFMSLNPEE